MKQDFAADELKNELERSLGFGLRSLERLAGQAWSLNFKAVRDDDGLEFVVKLTPATGEPVYEKRYAQTVSHLEALTDTKSARRMFPSCLSIFRNYHVCCLSWCPGVRLFPDRLTVGQMKAFLTDYLVFSSGMQKTTGIFPKREGLVLKAQVLHAMRGFWCRRLRVRLDAEMPDDDVMHRPELTRIIHGDFHYGNFLFEGGRLSGFFDLEEFRYGYPSEDLVRYVTCAVEHLRWYEQGRTRGIVRMFGEMVRFLPYSAHEWVVALNVHFLDKVSRRFPRGLNPFKVINLSYRYSLYRRLKDIARAGGRVI